MPNLTNANDTTELAYLFNTLDTELLSDENLRSYTENVDLGEYYLQLIFMFYIENYDFEYYSVTAEWLSQVLWYCVFQYLNKYQTIYTKLLCLQGDLSLPCFG